MPTGGGDQVGPAVGPVHVRADLRIDVDGSSAHLRGTGRRLELHLDDPFAVLAGVPRGGLGSVRVAARALDQAGLRLDVVSDRGRLMSVGAGVTSGASRLGLPAHVAVGSPTALAFLVGTAVRGRRARWVVAAGLSLSVLAALGRVRQSRSARR